MSAKPCGSCGGNTTLTKNRTPHSALRTPRSASRQEWAAWARGIALLSAAADRGVGDTVHRIIGDVNSARFKKWHRKLFKTDCGCAERQARWNAEYPYT